MERAKKRIEHVGFENAMKEWQAIVAGKKQLDADGVALGECIFAEAAHAQDTKLALKTAQELASIFTQAGVHGTGGREISLKPFWGSRCYFDNCAGSN